MEPLPLPLKGCRVKLQGAWNSPGNSEPELLLARSNGIAILSTPPEQGSFDEHKRVLTVAFVGVGTAILMAIIALAAQYRARKIVQGSEGLKKQLADARYETEQMVENRERLGRDLHDHIIQCIYAVGLNVEDCRELLHKEPEKATSRLKTAMMDINAVIRELRNVIMGLESNAIQPKEFRTALKSLALTMGQEHSSRVRVELEPEAIEALTPGLATEMLYISREAMSNAVRHGSAATTTFSLRLVEHGARFIIEDNGKGFDVESSERTGFGLRNMAKRAENLSAKFNISSEPGKGTRIVLDIPIQKQHFSTK
jgi:signal transduction histidine kinase